MKMDSRVILALDFASGAEALALVEQLDPSLCKLKVGKELFTREGPALVRTLVDMGFSVFLDLKFHDIPNTTARAVAAAADLGVWMVNVHASGGRKMMADCAHQLDSMGSDTLLIAVTVLTSMGASDLAEVGVAGDLESHVLGLARLANDAGLDGVVCSAQEAGAIAAATRNDFLRVTPGIRPRSAATDDQQRIMTPAQALSSGSSYLVIGRPVTRAQDPHGALLAILDEIREY